jgi:ureidoglycolate lyase
MSIQTPFEFTSENFQDPKLPSGLTVLELNTTPATEESLKGYGFLIDHPDVITTSKKNFEIVTWPKQGWRSLDPDTGNEAGTTEGNFKVRWEGDYYFAENLAVSTTNNKYLDGLGVPPEFASREQDKCTGDGNTIYLWMSDYHPDGGQLFWPLTPIPFVVALGLSKYGDDIRPENMSAFSVPAGYGVYIHPNTWHNGVYVRKDYTPATFLTRQGKVHARVSASWASEFNTLLKVKL